MKLAKGFKGKANSCYGVAIRRVHKALKYQYRDRRNKKRNIRRDWVHCINAAVREHKINYSRFVMCLNRSNIKLDRKILANLAVNEPYSFKSVVDEVVRQNDYKEHDVLNPILRQQRGTLFAEAIQEGKLRVGGPPTPEELAEIEASLLPEPVHLYGLNNPADAKTKNDYMRISFEDEDKEWLEDQKRMTLTDKEQKRLQVEVLTDNWQEDMSLYKHKRKP